MSKTAKTSTHGFTLLELMIVVAIIGITLAIGLPSLRSVIIENRLTASANDMLAALQTARSEATKHVKLAGVSISGNTWEVFVGSTDNVVNKYTAATNITLEAGDDPNLTYRPEGRLQSSTATTITFTSPGSSAKRTVTISPSGKVKITKS